MSGFRHFYKVCLSTHLFQTSIKQSVQLNHYYCCYIAYSFSYIPISFTHFTHDCPNYIANVHNLYVSVPLIEDYSLLPIGL